MEETRIIQLQKVFKCCMIVGGLLALLHFSMIVSTLAQLEGKVLYKFPYQWKWIIFYRYRKWNVSIWSSVFRRNHVNSFNEPTVVWFRYDFCLLQPLGSGFGAHFLELPTWICLLSLSLHFLSCWRGRGWIQNRIYMCHNWYLAFIWICCRKDRTRKCRRNQEPNSPEKDFD